MVLSRIGRCRRSSPSSPPRARRRVPGKNARALAGHPLVAYTIASARESGLFTDVLVSTDSPEIADISRRYGATAVSWPRLAEPMSPDIDWILHAMDGRADDEFAILRPTSPFRSAETLRQRAAGSRSWATAWTRSGSATVLPAPGEDVAHRGRADATSPRAAGRRNAVALDADAEPGDLGPGLEPGDGPPACARRRATDDLGRAHRAVLHRGRRRLLDRLSRGLRAGRAPWCSEERPSPRAETVT